MIEVYKYVIRKGKRVYLPKESEFAPGDYVRITIELIDSNNKEIIEKPKKSHKV